MARQTNSAVETLRWVSVPFAALSGFVLAFMLARAGGALLRAVVGESRVETLLPLDLRVGAVGAAAAFACVAAASITAPSAKRSTAVLIFTLGASAAWLLLSSWFFPESHPRAYQSSDLPLIGTYAGGLLGLVLVWLQTFPTARL